jgi:hypothetical protein
MFTQVETCAFVRSHAGLPIVPNEGAGQADDPEVKWELVTDLVTHTAAGGGYQTNSKRDMHRGAKRKRPNVLSPIWSLRMNRLPGLSSTTCRNSGWKELT